MEGKDRDEYGDQIVTCDVSVSLHSKTSPMFMKYSNDTSIQCYAYQYPSLFPVLFPQSLYVPTCFNCTAAVCRVLLYCIASVHRVSLYV